MNFFSLVFYDPLFNYFLALACQLVIKTLLTIENGREVFHQFTIAVEDVDKSHLISVKYARERSSRRMEGWMEMDRQIMW